MRPLKTSPAAGRTWTRWRRRLRVAGLILNLATLLYAGAATPLVLREIQAQVRALVLKQAQRDDTIRITLAEMRADDIARHVAGALPLPPPPPLPLRKPTLATTHGGTK